MLARITVSRINAEFDNTPSLSANSSANALFQSMSKDGKESLQQESDELQTHPMTDANAIYALGILSASDKRHFSRNREVFAALIRTHARNPASLSSLPRIVRHMCALQPPEFIYVSFGLELNLCLLKMMAQFSKLLASGETNTKKVKTEDARIFKMLGFATRFAQVMSNVLLTSKESEHLRELLKGCISKKNKGTKDERKAQLFHILLKTFAHDPVASISLCLWCGAFRTASSYIHKIDPLDLNLSFYMELDQLIEFIERPLFRFLHLSMLECDEKPDKEGSGAMLYRCLKSMLMLLPQSTSYNILQQRLLSVARFRQCAIKLHGMNYEDIRGTSTEVFVQRILEVRMLHCNARWRSIRAESLEPTSVIDYDDIDIDVGRRAWLGYADEEDEMISREKHLSNHGSKHQANGLEVESSNVEGESAYYGFRRKSEVKIRKDGGINDDSDDSEEESPTKSWKEYWAENDGDEDNIGGDDEKK